MRHPDWGTAACLGALAVLCGCTRPPPPPVPTSAPASQAAVAPVPLDRLFEPPPNLGPVIATVDGVDVPKEAFLHELRQMQVALSATGIPEEATQTDVWRGALERCIEHVLRERLAEVLEVSVNKSDVDAWLEELEARMKADPAFAAFLSRAGKTPEQRRLDGQREILQRGIIAQLRVQAMDALTAKALDYYERHPQDYLERAGTEVWRIYIKAPAGMMDRDRAAARARATGLARQARADPERFPDLARGHSDGGKASGGGYLGFVPEGAFAAELYQQVQTSTPGAVLPLHEDASGFYILRVGESRDARKIPFEEVKERILDEVFHPALAREVNERLAKLRSEKTIQVHPALGAAYQTPPTSN